MKILLLSWRCLRNPQSGGSEIYFHELAKRWVKLGNEVEWFSPEFQGCKREEIHNGIKIIRRGSRLTVYLAAFIYYLTKSKKDYDIIIDLENGFPFFSPLYARDKKIALHIQHMHKDQWFKQFKFPISYVGYFLESVLMPIVYKNRPTITISDSSAKEIMEEKIGKGKPRIINPGIEFYRKKKVSRNKKPTFLFLNRIKKYKGIDVLLGAINELKKRNVEADFLIAGSSGDYVENMMEFIKKNKLDNVKYLGKISENKKAELMRKSWAFLNPSSKEGWGIVNIEANYFGTPVIGSDIGGIRDSVIDGKTGFLFKYGDYKGLADKIEYLIKNKKKLNEMGKNAEKWAMNFSWDIKAKEYLRVLEEIAKN